MEKVNMVKNKHISCLTVHEYRTMEKVNMVKNKHFSCLTLEEYRTKEKVNMKRNIFLLFGRRDRFNDRMKSKGLKTSI